MIINTEGIIIRIPCTGISILSRAASGVKLINVKGDDFVASIAKVKDSGDHDDEVQADQEDPTENADNEDSEEGTEE